MGLVLTENGVEKIDKPKLSELGKKEVLGNSLKRLDLKKLELVKGGKTEKPKLCNHCFCREVTGENPYCLTCIPIVADIRRKKDAKERTKNLQIFIAVVLVVGLFVAVIVSNLAG